MERIENQQIMTLGFLQEAFHLFDRRQGMDHVTNSPDFAPGVKSIDAFKDVGHADSDDVAFADAEGLQAGRGRIDLFDQRRVAHRFAHKQQSRMIGMRFGRFCDGTIQ